VRLPLLLSWWREGVVGYVDVGKGPTFLYHDHVGIGLARGGAKILDPLASSITSLPNERFSPAVPMTDRLLATTGPGSRLGLLGLPSPMHLAVQ
jgi:hypothetical protein